MQVEQYICDGGALMIGKRGFTMSLSNNVGDGKYSVYLYSSDAEFYRANPHIYRWLGSVKGDNINIYYYDCLDDAELSASECILFTLTGSYFIYRSDEGDFAFVRK